MKKFVLCLLYGLLACLMQSVIVADLSFYQKGCFDQLIGSVMHDKEAGLWAELDHLPNVDDYVLYYEPDTDKFIVAYVQAIKDSDIYLKIGQKKDDSVVVSQDLVAVFFNPVEDFDKIIKAVETPQRLDKLLGSRIHKTDVKSLSFSKAKPNLGDYVIYFDEPSDQYTFGKVSDVKNNNVSIKTNQKINKTATLNNVFVLVNPISNFNAILNAINEGKRRPTRFKIKDISELLKIRKKKIEAQMQLEQDEYREKEICQ